MSNNTDEVGFQVECARLEMLSARDFMLDCEKNARKARYDASLAVKNAEHLEMLAAQAHHSHQGKTKEYNDLSDKLTASYENDKNDVLSLSAKEEEGLRRG